MTLPSTPYVLCERSATQLRFLQPYWLTGSLPSGQLFRLPALSLIGQLAREMAGLQGIPVEDVLELTLLPQFSASPDLVATVAGAMTWQELQPLLHAFSEDAFAEPADFSAAVWRCEP